MITPPNDEASFWTHVEELRKCLIKAIAVIALASLFTFLSYPALISLLSLPLQAAAAPNNQDLAGEKMEFTKVSNRSDAPARFSLPQGAALAVALSKGIEEESQNNFLIHEGGVLTYERAAPSDKLVILSPTEGIVAAFKVSFWIGFAASSPLWLYFIGSFIAPALNREEKRALLPCFALSLIFFSLGLLFCYKITLPLANSYLSLFNAAIGQNLWSLSHYLDYTLILMLANGIAFESAVILFCLVHFRLITPEAMRQKRRFAIVAIFIAAAILTPPDVVTQLLLALPLLLLYEAALLYACWRCKRQPSSEGRLIHKAAPDISI